MNKTVAIVGTHSGTRLLVPYDDPSVDIWVFNESVTHAPDGERWVKRCEAVFQMHHSQIFDSMHNLSDPKHHEWLREPHDFPIYMQEVRPEMPASVEYPREEMRELFENFYQGIEQKNREVYESSMDFAVALAIHLGYETIKVYGVECEADTEYQRQREGIKFWTGYALGRGIRIEFYSGDAMFDRPVYGYEGMIYQDIEEYREDEKKLNKEILLKNAELKIAGSAYTRASDNGNLAGKLADLLELNIEIGYLEGQLNVNKKYQQYINDGAEIIDPTEFEVSAWAAEKEFKKTEIQVHQSTGVLRAIFPAWNKSKDPTILAQIKTIGQQHINSGFMAGYCKGMKEENIRLGSITLGRMDAAGGKKAMEMVKSGNG